MRKQEVQKQQSQGEEYLFFNQKKFQNLQSMYSYLFLAVQGAYATHHLPPWVATVYCKVTDLLVTKSGSISADCFLLRGIRYLLIVLE